MTYFVKYFDIGNFYKYTLLSIIKPSLSDDNDVEFITDTIVEGFISYKLIADVHISTTIMSLDEVVKTKRISFEKLVEFNEISENEFVKLLLEV